MNPLIDQHKMAVRKLCEEYDVQRLDVFGSATTDSFDPDQSDLDFLVEFKPGTDLGPWMTRFFTLREALSSLLGRRVDLVFAESLQNRYFARAVNVSRQPIYASQDPETA